MSDPIVKRGSLRTSVGVEVDKLDVSLLCNSDSTIQGLAATVFCLQGGLDGATLEVDRQFSAGWESEACGSLNLFAGRVADVVITGTQVKLKVLSDLELLNVQLPRNIYQAPCIHTVYDGGCNLSAAAFTVTGNTTANSTRSTINCNLSTGNYALGTISFTTGALAGESRTIKASDTANGVLITMFPFAASPEAGDLFEAKLGCDRTRTTCDVTFNNTLNFRGYRTIPVPEATT